MENVDLIRGTSPKWKKEDLDHTWGGFVGKKRREFGRKRRGTKREKKPPREKNCPAGRIPK